MLALLNAASMALIAAVAWLLLYTKRLRFALLRL
jgi:hypothetical protein